MVYLVANLLEKILNAFNDIAEHAKEIASHMNTLAGKISMHLLMEDKHLYPNLIERGNDEVKRMGLEVLTIDDIDIKEGDEVRVVNGRTQCNHK